MTDMSMMEKLGFAAFTANFHPNDTEIAKSIWEDERWPEDKRRAFKSARAVLQALREADEGMFDILAASIGSYEEARLAHAAMIDHILNESGKA